MSIQLKKFAYPVYLNIIRHNTQNLQPNFTDSPAFRDTEYVKKYSLKYAKAALPLTFEQGNLKDSEEYPIIFNPKYFEHNGKFQLWVQKLLVLGGLGSFMIYFMILREENEFDDMLRMDPMDLRAKYAAEDTEKNKNK